ncbi:MAG: hypothetical protein OXH52_12335 [Gammaproteobacteria bacterium]|nr:hypothetical protein [Gammaproteobacteria bacterium]
MPRHTITVSGDTDAGRELERLRTRCRRAGLSESQTVALVESSADAVRSVVASMKADPGRAKGQVHEFAVRELTIRVRAADAGRQWPRYLPRALRSLFALPGRR